MYGEISGVVHGHGHASRLPDPENLAADLEVIPNAGMWEYEAETFQTFQWGFPEIGGPPNV